MKRKKLLRNTENKKMKRKKLLRNTNYGKQENEKRENEKKKLLRNTENKKMKNEKMKRKKLLRNTENKSINVIDWRIASICECNLVYGRPMLSNYWQNNCYTNRIYVRFWELL